MSIDLSPLHNIVDDLEKAVQGVAEKVSTAVSSDITQESVNELVGRVGAQVERLAGLQAPATQTSGSQAAAEPTADATPAAGTSETPVWTPEKPAA